MNGGWLGSASQLYNYLQVVNAKTDEGGKFLVRGNITSFLGVGDEFCVGEDAQYMAQDGSWVGLAAGLNQTSYGVRNITVI